MIRIQRVLLPIERKSSVPAGADGKPQLTAPQNFGQSRTPMEWTCTDATERAYMQILYIKGYQRSTANNVLDEI